MTYAEGAGKYGECNWQKGMPPADILNHVLDHVGQLRVGDTTEDHAAHAMWGLAAYIHFESGCRCGEWVVHSEKILREYLEKIQQKK